MPAWLRFALKRLRAFAEVRQVSFTLKARRELALLGLDFALRGTCIVVSFHEEEDGEG